MTHDEAETKKRRLLVAKPVLPKISPSVLANARNSPAPPTVSPAPGRGASPRTGLQRTKTELTRTNLSHQTSDRPTQNTKTLMSFTPRASKSRIRNDGAYRTPTGVNTRTLTEKRSQNMSTTGASPTVATSNRITSPVRVPVNTGRQTEAITKNTKGKPRARYESDLSTNESDQSFFYADAALSQPRSQRPPLVHKTSSFVHANGEEEGPERPNSPIILGSPFKDRRDESLAPQEPAILLENLSHSPVLSAVDVNNKFPPVLSPFFFRGGSPSKDNIHLSYRKGISQIFRPSESLSSSYSVLRSARPNLELGRRHSSLDTVSSGKTNPDSLPTTRIQPEVLLSGLVVTPKVVAAQDMPFSEKEKLHLGHTAGAPSVSSVISTVHGQSPSESDHCNKSSATSSSTDDHRHRQQDQAVSARRERKVLDLEISNSSLLAINKSLERELRSQKSELRYLRRVSRATHNLRLSDATTMSEVSELSDDASLLVGEQDNALQRASNSLDAAGRTSIELDPPSWLRLNTQKLESRRMNLDLTKHKDLLIENQRVNQSMHKCLCVVDQLVEDGNKALQYRPRTTDLTVRQNMVDTDEEDEIDEDSSMNNQLKGVLENETNVSYFEKYSAEHVADYYTSSGAL